MTKEKFAWSGLGVPLAWLAEFDNVPAPNALEDAFGDRYLYRHNPVFASIRDATLALGYRFSAKDTPLWRDYQALSLLSLQKILSSRTIPFFDTAVTVRRLIEANPEAKLAPGFIATNIKRNFAFHESAHCVAHSILRRAEPELTLIAPGEKQRFVLESVLAESFANTVEALGSLFHFMPIPDGVFYPLNSYWPADREREGILNRAAAELGIETRFRLLFASYFESNLATEAPTGATYERVAESAGCSAGHAGLAREITMIAFGLSTGFRESTTPAYFELLGYAREYGDLARSAWLSVAQNRSLALDLISRFRDAAGKA